VDFDLKAGGVVELVPAMLHRTRPKLTKTRDHQGMYLLYLCSLDGDEREIEKGRGRERERERKRERLMQLYYIRADKDKLPISGRGSGSGSGANSAHSTPTPDSQSEKALAIEAVHQAMTRQPQPSSQSKREQHHPQQQSKGRGEHRASQPAQDKMDESTVRRKTVTIVDELVQNKDFKVCACVCTYVHTTCMCTCVCVCTYQCYVKFDVHVACGMVLCLVHCPIYETLIFADFVYVHIHVCGVCWSISVNNYARKFDV
jgi:hypothetical protein